MERARHVYETCAPAARPPAPLRLHPLQQLLHLAPLLQTPASIVLLALGHWPCSTALA